MSSFKWRADEAVSAVLSGGVSGLNLAAERLKALAVAAAPVDLAVLRNSAQVHQADEGTRESRVTFDTPYAVIQHESLHFNHPNGGGAKYLEGPLEDAAGELRGIVAAAIRGEL